MYWSGAGLVLPILDAMSVESSAPPPGRLIVIFLRGGLDGLFAMAPVADPRLSELRPGLARVVLERGLPLGSSGFSVPPSATELADLFATRELSFAPCAGTVDKSRSHFQAQDLFELGSGATHGNSGFMARAAQAMGSAGGAISFTREVPLCFQGGESPPEVAPLTGSGLKLPQGRLLDAIREAHRGQRTGEALEQALLTDAKIDAAMQLDQETGMDPLAARGAPRANNLGTMAATMGRILRGNPRQALVFVELGGVDTHANEEAGLSNNVLPALGKGLVQLKQALGDSEWRRTRVVMMSEFGRTVRENGTRGTDHGHGGLFLSAGGAIAGGRMIGGFDGLADNRLHEHRDLPVLVDWRTLLAISMQQSCALGNAVLDEVFPGRPRQRLDI
jgi:uncharacterized protein (DUF1501 family)